VTKTSFHLFIQTSDIFSKADEKELKLFGIRAQKCCQSRTVKYADAEYQLGSRLSK
jgi:hypothetical protein